MRRNRVCNWSIIALILAAQSGCGLSQIQHRWAEFRRGGIVGEDTGSLESGGDPWVRSASQEMSVHHPPSYSDPSDRWLQSDRAREIDAAVGGGR